MQFGFRFKILLFSTSVCYSTKTLAYLAYKAYKAFMALKVYKAFLTFKRSRLNPFQKYRSITSFGVDWPRTIRLVCASVSILSVCTIKLQVIVNQNNSHLHHQNNNPRTNKKWLTKEFYWQKSRGSSCDPTLSVHDNVNHHQDNIRDQHVSTFTLIESQLVVMVFRGPMTTAYCCAFFSFCGGGKKKEDKKTKAFYDWATTSIPVKKTTKKKRRFITGLPQISQ